MLGVLTSQDDGYDVNVLAPNKLEQDDVIDGLAKHGDVTRNELVKLEERIDSMPLERTIPVRCAWLPLPNTATDHSPTLQAEQERPEL